jgi:hypothetical protein
MVRYSGAMRSSSFWPCCLLAILVCCPAANADNHILTTGGNLDAADRLALLDRLRLDQPLTTALQHDLEAGDVEAFDQRLLAATRDRHAGAFYFKPSDVETYLRFIRERVAVDDVMDRAAVLLADCYPEQDGAGDYNVQVPNEIDWHHTGYSDNPETIHTLNRHRHWIYLAIAYRLTGEARYGQKIVEQLVGWSLQNPALEDPEVWRQRLPHWWLMDAAVRADTWSWTYSLISTTDLWTPEVNTLFFYKMCQHGEFLSVVKPQDLRTNHALVHGQGLLTMARAFPEFRDADRWERRGRDLLFESMDAQHFGDGCNGEQSPNYAVVVVTRLLEMCWLDRSSGSEWPADRVQKLTRAVEAYYQLLSPDGNNPALSDSYRSGASTIFLEANLVLGGDRWPPARPRLRDVWLFGPDNVAPFLGHPTNPLPRERGRTYALVASGNYVMRSDSTPDARQIIFDAGPKGGLHGHFDLLNFELFGYGRPLIADPGLFRYDTSDDRLWVQSTPAHNTISVDGMNHGAIEGEGNPAIIVDQWHVADDHVQVTAHHFGYGGLPGRPVLARSIWYDFDGTMLVVDWGESVEPHEYAVSFTLPGTAYELDPEAGRIQSRNAGGGNVTVQALLRQGQRVSHEQRFTSSRPPPRAKDEAQRFVISQSGDFVAFGTLVTTYHGTEPPEVSAEWLTPDPKPGEAVVIRLRQAGTTREITFMPPVLQRLDAEATTYPQACDLAFDSTGRLHYVFFERSTRTLKYTSRGPGGRWSIVETIDATPGCGYHLSLAIDSQDRLGVAYTDAEQGDLKYAFYDGSAWTVQTVDEEGLTGYYPSLAFSRRDGAVISYYDKSHGNLRLATSITSGWQLQTIDTGGGDGERDGDVGRFSRLALDPSRPDASKWAIVYEDTGGQRYRYAVQGRVRGGQHGNDFSFFDVRTGLARLGGCTALAFDASHRPAVTIYDGERRRVIYAASSGDTFAGIRFDNATVANTLPVAGPTQLFFDSFGRANVFYFDSMRGQAVRAVSVAGVHWTAEDLGAGGREVRVSRWGDRIAFTSGDETGAVRVWSP